MARLPKFRLSTLLVVIVPLALFCLFAVRWYESRPIHWQPFTRAVFEERCRDGSPAIVFFYANWDVNSQVVEKITFNDRRVRELVHRKAVTPILVDCSSSSSDVLEAYALHGVNTTPYVFVYFPDAIDSPTTLRNVTMPEDILAAFARPATKGP